MLPLCGANVLRESITLESLSLMYFNDVNRCKQSSCKQINTAYTHQVDLIATLYPESIRQQKNSRCSLVAEIANISLANQITQKSTSEFKTSEKILGVVTSQIIALRFLEME